MEKLYRIAIQTLGNRERIELQGKERDGSWTMMKGYNLSPWGTVSSSEARGEKRKSVFALYGIASVNYSLTAQDIELDEGLRDYIID